MGYLRFWRKVFIFFKLINKQFKTKKRNAALDTFVSTFQQSLSSYKYPIKGPKVFKMKSRNIEDWKA